MKFEFNWPSGFRGEDVWKCWRTDGRRTTDDGRRSHWYTNSSPRSLRLRWAKNEINQQSEPPPPHTHTHLYTYEPPFQKSWIFPWYYTKQIYDPGWHRDTHFHGHFIYSNSNRFKVTFRLQSLSQDIFPVFWCHRWLLCNPVHFVFSLGRYVIYKIFQYMFVDL